MSDESGPASEPLGPAVREVVTVSSVDLTELGHRLDQAYRTFATDPRRGVGEMLTALMQVLKVTDPEMRRGHRELMAKLMTALADLDRGLQPELLMKAKLGHRPQQSLDVWRVRANAAHVADLLETTGWSADEANRAVARRLERHGVGVGRGRAGARSVAVVARWRAELEAGRAPREGQLAYQYPQRSVTGVPASLAPAEARRLLLETLEQQLRKDRRIEEGRDDTDFK